MESSEQSMFGTDVPVEMQQLGAILAELNFFGIMQMIKNDEISLVFDKINGQGGGPSALIIDEDELGKKATIVAAIDKDLLTTPEAAREISVIFGTVALKLSEWQQRGFTVTKLEDSIKVREFLMRKYLEDQR